MESCEGLGFMFGWMSALYYVIAREVALKGWRDVELVNISLED